MSWNIFPRWVDDPLINHNLIGRGWMIALWLTFCVTIGEGDRRIREVLGVIPLIYLVGIAVSSGSWLFGWYVFPAYPFLCLGMGRFLSQTWDRPTLLRGFVVVCFLTMYTFNFSVDTQWAKLPESWPILRREVQFFLAAALGPFVLATAMPRHFRWLGRLGLIACLVVVAVLGCRFVVQFEEIADTYKNFDRDMTFRR